MSKINRNVRAEFGILNIGGYMIGRPSKDGSYSEIINPLFAHDSYTIKTTFNRNIKYNLDGEEKFTSNFGNVRYEDASLSENEVYYQKNFRRDVLWDFGDGTKIEGADVEHTYKKPGRYKISCTFFDVNRQGWKNTYSIIVQVKEVFPTSIRFSENSNNFKSEIKCSKIEQIAKIEALLSKDTDKLNLIPKRIFTEDELKSNTQQAYDEVKNVAFYHMKPYYCFLSNEKKYFLNSEEIQSSYMKPIEKYEVEYYEIYGKFQYDKLNKNIILKLYLLHPFKVLDNDHKKVKCIDPNCDILSEIQYKDVDIKQIYTMDEVENVFYVGKRGFVDVYYKNDYLSKKNNDDYLKDNVFAFFYDLEEKNIINDIKNSVNYLNNIPLGMSIAVKPNNIYDVKISLSLNGFLRNVNPLLNYHVDEFFINSLVKDYSINGYFMPYILYEGKEEILEELDLTLSTGEIVDFKVSESSYYVPKDIILDNIEYVYNIDNSKGYQSSLSFVEDYDGATFKKYNFVSRDYIDHTYTIGIKNIDDIFVKNLKMDIKRYDITDIKKLIIPTEKYVKVDVKKLMEVYMGHPMFEEAHKLKDGLISLLKNNNLLSYIMTKSENFLDDRANIRTCYLSNLLSTLRMMGEEIVDYETTEFEGINEMRDFVRLLSMNHNDLVGHIISKPYDIHINSTSKGKNVGRKMDLRDRIYIKNDITRFGDDGRGLILGYKSKNNPQYVEIAKSFGTNLILHDKYTNETRPVSFTTTDYLDIMLKKDEVGYYISLKDYDPSWGWNLLLTERFEKANNELKNNNLTSLRRKRLEEICENVIDGYYDFYLIKNESERERVGNFVEDDTITKELDDVELWESEWGYVNDILMKIIIDKAGLRKDDIPVIRDENDDNSTSNNYIAIKKNISNDKDIKVSLLFGGEEENTLYITKDSNIELMSVIGDQINNNLNVYINDFYIRDFGDENFSAKIQLYEGQKFVIPFRYDGQSLNIVGSHIPLYDKNNDIMYNSEISIEISGTLENPSFDISIIIDIPL